jgi:hypothetical protein
MADEKEVVSTEQNATAEDTEVDYEKELETVTKKTKAEIGYAQRHKDDEKEIDDKDDVLAEKVAGKLFPKLQAQQEKNLIDQRLETLSKGNQALKKLIQYHLENSVNPNLDLESRLDVAYAAANKKRIEKTAQEINIAQQNRGQLPSGNQGTSTETIKKPGANVVSDEQLKNLRHRADTIGRAAGWSEKQKEKFVEDAIAKLSSVR